MLGALAFSLTYNLIWPDQKEFKSEDLIALKLQKIYLKSFRIDLLN